MNAGIDLGYSSVKAVGGTGRAITFPSVVGTPDRGRFSLNENKAIVLDVPGDVDAASLYVNPGLGIELLDDIAKKGIKTLFVNPGAESNELVQKAESLGMRPLLVCSILSIGVDPEAME